MSSLRRTFTRAVTYSIMMSTAFADVITLKSGEKVEGKVLKEKVTDQQITVEIKVGGGIFDERIIPRADIDHIDMVSPETEAFKQIMTVQTGPNSLSSAQYEPPIRTLQEYLKKYPNGSHTKEVQTALNDFLSERKRVDAGEVKLHGEWINKEQAAKEKIQIEGTLAFEYMKSQSAAGDNIGALNTFVAIEKNAPGSAVTPDAIDLAKQLIAGVKPAVERAIPEQKVLKAEKEKGFAEAGPAERPEMIASYKADMAQAESMAAAAEKTGNWPPYIRTNEKALTTLLARIGRESARLAALPVDNMRKSLEFTTTAKQKLDARDFDAANAALKEAGTLWPANELVKRLTADVVAEKAAVPKEAAPPAPTPDTPKPKATPTKPNKPSATPVKSAAATAAPDESSSFSIPVAITAVVAIATALVGVNVYKKMKAKKDDAGIEIR